MTRPTFESKVEGRTEAGIEGTIRINVGAVGCLVTTITVPGMTCGNGEQTVEDALVHAVERVGYQAHA